LRDGGGWPKLGLRMKLDVDIANFTHDGRGKLDLVEFPHRVDKPLYSDEADYDRRLGEFREEIDDLQTQMYAHDRYAMLIVFQAMDAAGKDGTIRNVMRGVNPHGIQVISFKHPSHEELDHGFLWRTNKAMPERGRITIFNRSYYEEVLITKVHPEIVTKYQKLPEESLDNLGKLWERRYTAIRNMESYLHDNGTRVVKFFLNVSKDEQKRRFIDRIDKKKKNWKFSEGDLEERKYWNDYMAAYRDCIAETSTKDCPWYIVPADDKPSMRLIVSKIVLERLQALDMHWPKVTDERREELARYRARLQDE
jgi:PPK2 family polyphosphate:nucleotide phosphotransferase